MIVDRSLLLNNKNSTSVPELKLTTDKVHIFATGKWVPLGSMITHPSKCNWRGPLSEPTDVMVIHYMSCIYVKNIEDPYDARSNAALLALLGLSAHYVIERSGKIYMLAPTKAKALHAGKSIMPEPDNRNNLNDFSIGVEAINRSGKDFTEEQYDSIAEIYREHKSLKKYQP